MKAALFFAIHGRKVVAFILVRSVSGLRDF